MREVWASVATADPFGRVLGSGVVVPIGICGASIKMRGFFAPLRMTSKSNGNSNRNSNRNSRSLRDDKQEKQRQQQKAKAALLLGWLQGEDR